MWSLECFLYVSPADRQLKPNPKQMRAEMGSFCWATVGVWVADTTSPFTKAITWTYNYNCNFIRPQFQCIVFMGSNGQLCVKCVLLTDQRRVLVRDDPISHRGLQGQSLDSRIPGGAENRVTYTHMHNNEVTLYIFIYRNEVALIRSDVKFPSAPWLQSFFIL